MVRVNNVEPTESRDCPISPCDDFGTSILLLNDTKGGWRHEQTNSPGKSVDQYGFPTLQLDEPKNAYGREDSQLQSLVYKLPQWPGACYGNELELVPDDSQPRKFNQEPSDGQHDKSNRSSEEQQNPGWFVERQNPPEQLWERQTSPGELLERRNAPGYLSERENDQRDQPREPQISERPQCQGQDLPHVGEDIRQLQPDINPRLGCALAVSTALHERFPDIKATNNSTQLERELRAHGYEMVHSGQVSNDTVRDGDVIIGRRPFGMPSHVAMVTENVAPDGSIRPGLYQNNSNTGRIENNGDLNQFNQGMHDKQGHWNANGFDNVIVLRRISA